MERLAPKGLHFVKPKGGLLLWCSLDAGINERTLYQEAERRGLLLIPGFLFYPKGHQGGGHIRLCYSNISDEDIARGVELLGQALDHSVE